MKWCYRTGEFAMAASQNGFNFKLSLPKKTNLAQKEILVHFLPLLFIIEPL
jgi:hypothetical protein